MSRQPIPITDFIASLPLFAQLDPAALARLAAGIAVIDAPKGSVLLRRGDACNGFHVVVFGQVKLCLQTVRGDEKVVGLLGRGDSFGESAMFLNEPYRICAEALADSKLIHVSKATVLAEIERDARFAHRIITGLSQRLSRFITDVEGYTLRSGTQRVIAYLLKQLPAETHADRSAITFSAQKGIIASRLNLTQEHFSRILHELSAARLIEVRGRVVRILDAQELRSRAA